MKVITIQVVVLLSLFLGVTVQAEEGKPNVLLVLLDNTGWGDFGVYGGGALRGAPTPSIDELASEGMRLQNFNTEAQCTPSRSALMTGRYAIRSGTQSVPLGTRDYGLVPWEITVADAFSEKGYATGIFGKWHLGHSEGRYPTDNGFDEWYGIANSSGDSINSDATIQGANSILADTLMIPEAEIPKVLGAKRGETPKELGVFDIPEKRKIDGDLTEKTIDFIRRQHEAGKPFFAYVPLTAMHFPTLPSREFEGKSGHGQYADLLIQSDHYIGKMVKAVDDLDLADDTIVIVTVDNGVEAVENGDGQYTGWTGPWSGTYFTAMEGGIRTPFLIRWPGKISAGAVNNEIVHLVDIFPTLAGMVGLDVPEDRPIDGIDMTDFFLGKVAASGREHVPIFVGDDFRAFKWRNWKVHYAWAESKYDPVLKYSTVPKVIDLTRDPGEENQSAEPYNAWLPYVAREDFMELFVSTKLFPNVPVGAPNSYSPGMMTKVMPLLKKAKDALEEK